MRRPKTRSAGQGHPSVAETIDHITPRNPRPLSSSTSLPRSGQARSRSRARSHGRKGIGAHPTHHASTSRHRDRKQSRPSHNRPSSKDKHLVFTPSRIWCSMPIKFRVIALLFGFMFVYYGVFGKHHYFDREMSAIQTDLEKLLQHANRTGFMHRNFVEAELPEIFRNAGDPLPTRSPTPSVNKKDGPDSKDSLKTTDGGDMKDDSKEVDNNHTEDKPKDIKTDKMGKNKNKKKGRKKDKKDKKFKKFKKKKDKQEKQKMDKSEKKRKKDKKEQALDDVAEDDLSNKLDNKGAGAESSKISENSEKKENDYSNIDKSHVKDASTSKEGTGDDANSLAPSELENIVATAGAMTTNVTNSPVSASKVASALSKTGVVGQSSLSIAGNATSGDAGVKGSGRDSITSAGLVSDAESNSTAKSTSKTSKEISTATVSDPLAAEATAASTATNGLKGDNHDFSKDFDDMTPAEVPKEHLPVLSWNYKSVLDPSIPEQIFGLGDKLDHVAVYKPLCISPSDGVAYIFEGKTICSGFNRTTGWLIQYCSVMRESLQKEYLLSVHRERKTRAWLKDNKESIRWVEGLTVLQILEKNCGNIAHYSGRILLLQHIMENIMAYVAPPSRIMNVLIVPTFHIMKRFLYPHNYEHWHKTLLTALVTPSNYTIGTLGNFLYRDSKPRQNKEPMIQLLHNFSTAGSADAHKKYVCFRRVVIPGYLKARFFVNDIEYPSTKPSLQSKLPGAPTVPRDSLRMRERVSAVLSQNVNFAPREKIITLLDRNGVRRVFGPEAREKVLGMMKKVAEEKGYTFTISGFDNMTFANQYDVMKSVSIAVGIHGANLVNTMFMPPLAVLFELFPYGFRHEMYVNGGNAGLKYFSYQMKDGLPFEGPQHYRSVEQCVRLNNKCKVHYRDSTLKVNDEDMKEMERMLREAITWCDSLPSDSGGGGGSGEGGGDDVERDNGDGSEGNNRRRRRRRRLLSDRAWG